MSPLRLKPVVYPFTLEETAFLNLGLILPCFSLYFYYIGMYIPKTYMLSFYLSENFEWVESFYMHVLLLAFITFWDIPIDVCSYFFFHFFHDIVFHSMNIPWFISPLSFQGMFGLFLSSIQSLSRVLLFATPWTVARWPPCPSPTPGVHPNPCPLSQWCHPTISSSVIPFSSCLQSFPASESDWNSKVLELQLQHQSFQWIFRTDLL